MARKYVYRYIVEGRGPLPLDMLRYDGSYPASEADAAAAGNAREYRRVTLEHVDTRRDWCPCAERWRSFLWAPHALNVPAAYD